MQRPAADVCQRQYLEHAAVGDLLDDLLGDQGTEGVEDGLCPGRHLLVLAAGEVAEILAADGVQRPEHHDPPVQPAFHHRFEAGTQRQRRLAGTGSPAQGDDPDVGVEQQVERDPLFRGPPVQAERLPVATDQPHLLVRGHPAQRGGAAAGRGEHQPRVARQSGGVRDLDGLAGVEPVQVVLGNGELRHAAPAGVHRRLRPVLLGGEPDRGCLHPQRQVLGDQDDVVALPGKIERDGKNARVIVIHPEPRWEYRRVGVIEFDP